MGNRAVITTQKVEKDDIGVYLHWNGGRDSVEAFLTYCKMQDFRTPETDNYGWARLCQVIGNYFGGGLSLGIDKCSRLDCDNCDNGTYIIKDWEIVDREFFDRRTEQQVYGLFDMLVDIDGAQPKSMQLGKEKIKELLKNDIRK